MPFLPSQHSVMPPVLDEDPPPFTPPTEPVLVRCPVDGCRVVLQFDLPPLEFSPFIEDEAQQFKEAMIRASELLAEQVREGLDTHAQARHDPDEFAAAIAAAAAE